MENQYAPIARKTGAKVVGHETAITILRAYGIPDEQLYTVRGGEDYQFDDFLAEQSFQIFRAAPTD